MTVKSASEVFSILDQRDTYENTVQAKVAEIDKFIAGVEYTAKQAGLSEEAYAHMWGAIIGSMEKQASPIAAMGPGSSISNAPERKLTEAEANAVAIPADEPVKADPKFSPALAANPWYSQQAGAPVKEQPIPTPARSAMPGTMTPEQQLSPMMNPILDPDQPTTKSMTAPVKAREDLPPVPAQQPWGGVDWKDPKVWGKSLVGAGVSGLAALVTTALLGNKDEQGRKHYVRNALLSALLGGAAAPYLMNYASGKGPAAADWLKEKGRSALDWMTGKQPAQAPVK